MKNLHYVSGGLSREEALAQSHPSHAIEQHPLIEDELPHNPRYCIYNHRLMALTIDNASTEEQYWALRRHCVLLHTGELPIECRGPDAEKLLNRLLTRDVATIPVGRCSYQFPCTPAGGMMTDGILMRLASNRFWYVQADGNVIDWFTQQAEGLSVDVFDPHVWVSQVQGPTSLSVLAEAIDGMMPTPFNYFDIAEVDIAGERLIITRTGFTNELGWEFYLEAGADVRKIGDKIKQAGSAQGLLQVAIYGFTPRRIEGGILSARGDFDNMMNPFEAGLGAFVNLEKSDFIGQQALAMGEKRQRVWGLRCPSGVAGLGTAIQVDGKRVGTVTSTSWSPYQQCGVSIARFDEPIIQPKDDVSVICTDGRSANATVCQLPMYDQDRKIPRGLLETPDF